MKVPSVRALPVVICALLSASLAGDATAAAARFAKPLPAEPVPNVLTLPARYPRSWAFLNYASDRIELRDVGSDSRKIRGQVQARDSSTLLMPKNRPEFYVADTVWSRYTRGVRTDYISVYDTRTLDEIGEIVLPGAKRALITAMQGMFAFTDHERMALVFDFTPASSVTVVDLLKRKVLNSIDIPGCSLIYPSGERGFATLCASGTLLSVSLDAAGKVTGRHESRRFNALDTDPLFTASAAIHGIRYFPSLHGMLRPIDMSAAQPEILPSWPLRSPREAAEHWRPSGWQLVAGDGARLLYVLMQPNGHQGTHKDPGTEIWVFDVAAKARVKRLRLVRPGSSIALSGGSSPLLLVQAGERLDVYDPSSGSLIRSLNLPGFHTRMLIQPVP
ncbi:MAG TPA: amine dehydrogenase large subunit [Steroidobacteraceae bacterium]|nr:amine dehydrogenase large subunit [Steroidobacteraceae bacterium]